MNYPKHIGIIPDGNRTWATEQDMPSFQGHIAGYNTATELAKYIFAETPVKVMTYRGMSTENLKRRSKEELDKLFTLFKSATDGVKDLMKKHKINIRRVGSTLGLPKDLVDYFREQEKIFSFDSDRRLVVCINYGGRDEILRGIKKLHAEGVDIASLTEEDFSAHLDFGDLPALDLVIRTKGEMARRTSGFLSRWIGYAELFFSKLQFPAFGVEDMKEALQRFDSIVNYRNFGK